MRVRDYEGYGIYEFDGVGQLPAGVSVEDIVAHMDDYIIAPAGIQLAKTEVQQPVMDALDKMAFNGQAPMGAATITGTASFSLFNLLGDPWATNYHKQGYAVLVNKASVSTGSPQVMLTSDPAAIAGAAAVGKPYVVIVATDTQLAQAGAILAGTAGTQATPPPPVLTQAKATMPAWVLPVVIGVGALAAMAVMATISK